MIKILFLNPSSQLGGAEWVLFDIATRLDRSRFTPLVALPKEGPLADQLREADVEVRFVNAFEKLLGLGRYSRPADFIRAVPAGVGAIRGLFQITQLIEAEKIDIVHVHGIKMHLLSSMLSFWIKPKIIWHLHDFVSHRRFYRLFLLLADVCPSLIMVNSHAVARDLEATRNVVVVHNGVDIDRFSPRAALDQKDDLRRIGMIGILAPWKGHHIFLEAARKVRERRNHVQFWIVGDEIYDTAGHQGYREQLERWVNENRLQEQVRFTGFRSDVAEVIYSLDMIVHASIEPEPFGRVLIEAMACGKPVIAAKTGGVPEIVEPDISGLLTMPGNSDQLADMMLRLLDDETERRRVGAAGRRRVEQHFSLAQQVEHIEAMYEQLATETQR